MSWSVNFVGTTQEVCGQLQKHSEEMQDGQSQKEYNSALVHLIGLVKQNFSTGGASVNVRITASGHGYAVDNKDKERQCVVTLERI